MISASNVSLKKTVAAGLVAFAAFASSPAPAPAAGLGDLFAAMRVQAGCSSFISPYGHQVPVRYFLPDSGCAGPAVILLHGIDGGDRHGAEYEHIGRGLAAKGYAAFIVYYYQGTGGFGRPHPASRSLPQPETFEPWVNTVKASVDYVKGFGCVDPNRIGLMGMSLGGFVGSSAAVNNPSVKSLVVLSGGIPEVYADKIQTMPPTLLIHGAQDVDVPLVSAQTMHHALNQRGQWSALEVLPCEGHLPFKDHEGVANRVLQYLDRSL